MNVTFRTTNLAVSIVIKIPLIYEYVAKSPSRPTDSSSCIIPPAAGPPNNAQQ